MFQHTKKKPIQQNKTKQKKKQMSDARWQMQKHNEIWKIHWNIYVYMRIQNSKWIFVFLFTFHSQFFSPFGFHTKTFSVFRPAAKRDKKNGAHTKYSFNSIKKFHVIAPATAQSTTKCNRLHFKYFFFSYMTHPQLRSVYLSSESLYDTGGRFHAMKKE